MASRTQLRLGQITGSFGDVEGGIVDNLPFDSAATLAGLTLSSGSMVGVMSEFASSLLRLHGGGGNTFLGNAESTLTDINGDTRITYVEGAKTLIVGEGSGADSVDINAAGGFDVDAVGAVDILAGTSFSIDGTGTASNITLTTDGDGQDLTISQVGGNDSSIVITAAGTGADAIKINATGGGIDIDADSGALSLDGSSGINIGTESDVAIDIDSSTLDIDASGNITIDASAGSISIGTNSSGRAINIGHLTSEVTINDNLTVSGDLTVNGTTVTLDVTNQSLQDQLIILNSGSAANPVKQDVGIIFAQPDISRVLYVDDSDSSKFVFATTYTSGTATGTNAVTKLGDADVSMGNLNVTGLTDNQIVFPNASGLLEGSANLTFDDNDLILGADIGIVFGDAGEKIEGDGTDLKIVSSNLLNLDAGDKINIKEGGTLFGQIAKQGDNLRLTASLGAISLAPNNGIINIEESGFTAAIIESKIAQSTLTLSASTGNNLILGSNDTYIQFDVAEAEIFRIQSGGGEAILSSSADRQISLYPNDGKVTIYQNNTAGNPALGLFIDAGKDSSTLTSAFVGVDGFKNLEIDGSPGTEKLIVSGTHLALSGGAAPQELRFFEPTSAGENYVALEAADSIASNFTISLPNAIGTAGQVLKIASVGSDDAQLEFGSAVGDLARFGYKINSTIAAGNVVFGTVPTGGVTALTSYTNVLNITKAEGVLDDTLEVFVNGQLLVSGAAADADRDYTFVDSETINFAFSLELDDIVQIIQR